jgi:hypothetical protein
MRSSRSFSLVSRRGADVLLKPASDMKYRATDTEGDRGYLNRKDKEGITFSVEIGPRVILLVSVLLSDAILSLLSLLLR